MTCNTLSLVFVIALSDFFFIEIFLSQIAANWHAGIVGNLDVRLGFVLRFQLTDSSVPDISTNIEKRKVR